MRIQLPLNFKCMVVNLSTLELHNVVVPFYYPISFVDKFNFVKYINR